MDELWYSFIW